MRRLIHLTLASYLILLSIPASAVLIDRGNGLIYDSDLNITWLADANYAGTSGFSGVYGTGGRMSWHEAIDWTTNLNYGGYSGWRLPTTLQPDPSCSIQANVSAGYCSGSELGHLFNVELGGILNVDVLTIADPNLGLFQNIFVGGDGAYWSSTEYAPEPVVVAWVFNGSNNTQNGASKSNPFFAWAVHDGDIASVPEPSTLLLMATGLAGLGFASRKKKQA